MSAPGLEISGLAVRFAAATIVEDVTMSVPPGEMIGLVGFNGAGKTTTLRAISGVVRRAGGELSIDGTQLPTRPELVVAAGVSHVPEGRRLFADLTVEANLLVAARGSRSDRRSRVHEIVEMLPVVGDHLHAHAGNLSGGEQQLVAVARGLVTRPRVLLIDEMSLGLSPIALDRTIRLLGEVARAQSVGMLLVDQNVDVMEHHCDRLYILRHGMTREVLESERAEIWKVLT